MTKNVESKQPGDGAVPGSEAPRVLHFVTGGFSGATQVAIDLCLASLQTGRIAPLLVLRRKRNTDEARVQALRDKGLQVWVLPGWSHLATLWALRRLCLALRPRVMMAHGFPEHLLGRWAALWAGVPVLTQVEHNSRERYSAWRLWQARRLAGCSAKLVGVSEGVRRRLLELGMPAAKTLAIPNGIDLRRFEAAQDRPFAGRLPQLVMSARFARQKDHLTLIRALHLLRQQDLTPKLKLGGAGKAVYRRAAEDLVRQLGLQDQVEFLGHYGQMPRLLMESQICVLSTHYEGMPLALVEGMAAGCACVASDVVGVSEVLSQDETGLLVPEGDAQALAAALAALLREPGLAERLGQAARARALAEHGMPLMILRYEDLLLSL